MTTLEVARNIVALMRLWAAPSISFPVFSPTSFSVARDDNRNDTTLFYAFETSPRKFCLTSPFGLVVSAERLDWVVKHWSCALELRNAHPNFGLALDALDSGQFIDNPSLILVALWGALEALFSPDKGTELSFRVSSLIACYLEEPGKLRRELQREVKSLYNHRSRAAHGSGKSENKAVLDSFNLLRRILLRMISTNHVPSQADLEGCLFGISDEDDD